MSMYSLGLFDEELEVFGAAEGYFLLNGFGAEERVGAENLEGTVHIIDFIHCRSEPFVAVHRVKETHLVACGRRQLVTG